MIHNDAFDDQVAAALRDCDAIATCKELAIHLGDKYGCVMYARVYGSLCRLNNRGRVVRKRYASSANVFWCPTQPSPDLSALEWTDAKGTP